MDLISVASLFNAFILASFLGWIYECLYCTIKTTRWQNRGFLFGPICPIYGFGYLGGILVFQYLIPWIEGGGPKGMEVPASAYVMRRAEDFRQILFIFLICAVGCTVLEFFTSWLLEKLFHARWWDYSHDPLNLNGRICLPASLAFGIAGVAFIGYILPAVNDRMTIILPVPVRELLSLFLMFFMAADMVLSAAAATRLLERIEGMETVFDEKLETGYEPIGRAQRAAAEMLENVKDEAADVLVSVKDGAGGVLGTMRDGATGVLGTVKDSAGGVLGTVKDGAGGVLGTMRDGATGVVGGVKSGASGIVGSVKSGASGMIGSAKDSTYEWLMMLKNGTRGTAGKMAWAGRSVLEIILAPFQKNTLMNIEKYSSEKNQGKARKVKDYVLQEDSDEGA